MNSKTRLEKVLHEIIRDLPRAAVYAQVFEVGCMTFDEALKEVIKAYQEEKERSATA